MESLTELTEQIIDGNIRIARFMKNKTEIAVLRQEVMDGYHGYHNDWNLLMPVIQRIKYLWEENGFHRPYLHKSRLLDELGRLVHLANSKNMKETFYFHVLKFIDWYNSEVQPE